MELNLITRRELHRPLTPSEMDGNFEMIENAINKNAGGGGSGLPCEIVNTLTETTPGKALDATMGKVLNDTKLNRSNPSYTGHMWSTGTMSIEGKVWSEEEVGSQNIYAESNLTLGPDAIIRYVSGFSGGSPIYNTIEPEDIMVKNGTNYLMVYGTGTPAENGAELLAAYEAAKRMPRYLGLVDDNIRTTLYKGQTYRTLHDGAHYKMLVDYTGYPPTETGEYSIYVTEAEAKSPRTTLIVAPGDYHFGYSSPGSARFFYVTETGINIVSLTGLADVNMPVFHTSQSDFCLFKGINCTVQFAVDGSLPNTVFDTCSGPRSSFSSSDPNVSTYINCIGGLGSFRSDEGYNATLIGCRLTSGTFMQPESTGRLYNCIDGNGNLVNSTIPTPVYLTSAGTLPSASTGIINAKYVYVNTTSAPLAVTISGGGFINGSTNPAGYSIPAYTGVVFVTDGSKWWTL